MDTTRAEVKTSPLEPVTPFCLLLGLGAGLLFLILVQLPIKWFLTLFAGTLLLGASIIIEDKKKFYLTMFVLALPIGLSKTFGFTVSATFRSTFGYTVYAGLVPLFALYFIWIYRRVFREVRLPVSTRGMLPFAGLFLMSALSCLLARNAYAVYDLFMLACSVVLFVYMSSAVRTIPEMKLVAVLLILLATFEGLLALAQYLSGSSLGFGFVGRTEFLTGYVGLLSVSRVMGTVGHPNSLAMLFDFLLPFSFAFLLFYPMKPWQRALTALAVAVQYLGVGVTFSRGGITCTSLAMAAILFIYLKRRLEVLRGIAVFLFIAMVSVILLLVIPNPIQKGLFRTEAETAYGRVPLVRVALNVMRERPLFGLGLNNYVAKVAPYDNTPEQLNQSWNSPVHNLFLFIAGEIGVLGLIFFLWLLWTALHPLPAFFSISNPVLSSAAMGVFWGSLAFLGHCMVDLTLWTHPRLHWFMLGLAVSIWHLSLPYLERGQMLSPRPDAPALNLLKSHPGRTGFSSGRTGI